MTVNLFLTLLAIFSILSSVITEALKKIDFVAKKPTVVVAIISTVLGWGGSACAYILMGIAFTAPAIVALILMAPAVFLSATLGYDKIKEIILQIVGIYGRC